MKLFTKAQWQKLIDNGRKQYDVTMQEECGPQSLDFAPVVKLFNPAGAGTWLLSEIDHEDHDRAFGLCDLGHGYPELGWVSFRELLAVKLPFGLKIERDRHFKGNKPISEYANDAREKGYIGV